MFHEKEASIAPFFICSLSLMGINDTLSHWFWPFKVASNSLGPCCFPPLSNLFIHIQDEVPVHIINQGLMLASWSKVACLLQSVLSCLFFFQYCLWMSFCSTFCCPDYSSFILSMWILLCVTVFYVNLLSLLPTYLPTGPTFSTVQVTKVKPNQHPLHHERWMVGGHETLFIGFGFPS
jgi:magnesium-transporting ATPase (P-type)